MEPRERLLSVSLRTLGYVEFMRGRGFFLTPMKLGVVRMTSLSAMKLPGGTSRATR